jgi:hypothetical protein
MKLKQERNEWSEKIGQLKMQSTEIKVFLIRPSIC